MMRLTKTLTGLSARRAAQENGFGEEFVGRASHLEVWFEGFPETFGPDVCELRLFAGDELLGTVERSNY